MQHRDDHLEQKENLEIHLLMEAINTLYGFDFHQYTFASIRRRINHLLAMESYPSISHLQHAVIYQEAIAEKVLAALSIQVTEMFRDPAFMQTLRERVLPQLKEPGHLKIWHAGCATGEEVYSMAILLTEAGLYHRSRLYATDFNREALEKARKGIFALDRMRQYVKNYQDAGGTQSFADYYHADFGSAAINQTLKKNIVFAHHNLTSDEPFGDMQLILCRNVLIYFNRDLQSRVFRLFHQSLTPGGFLALGSHESLTPDSMHLFKVVDAEHNIFARA